MLKRMLNNMIGRNRPPEPKPRPPELSNQKLLDNVELANRLKQPIDDFSKRVSTLDTASLNGEMASLMQAHKPIYQEHVDIGVRVHILSTEMKLKTLRNAYPDIPVVEEQLLFEVKPGNTVLGPIEEMIKTLREQKITPSAITIDRINRTIRILK